MVYLNENYCFPRFQRASFSMGGWNFFGGARFKMLISIETYRTYDLSGGGEGGRGPIPPQIRAFTHFLEFKVIFLAPFNYVETHCT